MVGAGREAERGAQAERGTVQSCPADEATTGSGPGKSILARSTTRRAPSRLPGYTEREMANDVEEFNSRLHPEDKPAHEQAIRPSASAARTVRSTFEMRLQTKDGGIPLVPLSAGRAMRTPAGRARRMAGAMTEHDPTAPAERSGAVSRERARSSHPGFPSPTA